MNSLFYRLGKTRNFDSVKTLSFFFQTKRTKRTKKGEKCYSSLVWALSTCSVASAPASARSALVSAWSARISAFAARSSVFAIRSSIFRASAQHFNASSHLGFGLNGRSWLQLGRHGVRLGWHGVRACSVLASARSSHRISKTLTLVGLGTSAKIIHQSGSWLRLTGESSACHVRRHRWMRSSGEFTTYVLYDDRWQISVVVVAAPQTTIRFEDRLGSHLDLKETKVSPMALSHKSYFLDLSWLKGQYWPRHHSMRQSEEFVLSLHIQWIYLFVNKFCSFPSFASAYKCLRGLFIGQIFSFFPSDWRKGLRWTLTSRF